ncbi:MAG: HEAT repeat domain-containing protein [Blastocatellia bacterium]|jgi:HEAT repeat protein
MNRPSRPVPMALPLALLLLVTPGTAAAIDGERGHGMLQPLYVACAPASGPDAELPALPAEGGGDPLFLEKGRSEQKIALIERVRRACQPASVARLLVPLEDEDLQVRLATIEALGQIQQSEAIEPLIERIGLETDWQVRTALARSLASFQVHLPSSAVLNLIANPGSQPIRGGEPELRTRCAAVLVINQLRDVRYSRKAVVFLFAFLDLPDPHLVKVAEEALTLLRETRNGYHEMVGIIRKHGFPDHRSKAAVWLGRWRATSARPVLLEVVAKETHPLVLQAVKDALTLLDKPASQ